MRWGVRRTPEQLGHKTNKKWAVKKKKTSEEKKEEKYNKKKAKLDAKEKDLQRKEEIKRQEADIQRRQRELKEKSKLKVTFTPPGSTKDVKKTVNTSKMKNAKSMTDEELRNFINRYNMEKQYDKIVKEQASSGKSWVSKMLADVGKQVATEYTKKAVVKAIDSAIEASKRQRGNNSGGNH